VGNEWSAIERSARTTALVGRAEIAALLRSVRLVALGLLGDDGIDAAESLMEQETPTLPVLALHGFTANRADLIPMCNHIRSAGFGRVYSYTAPMLTADVHELAQGLAERVDVALERCGSPAVHLIGHSLGGIVARYAVTYLGLESKVASVTTLGAPHGGAPLAKAATLIMPPRLARSLASLVPGSSVLRSLEADARPSSVEWRSVGSMADVLVPAARARMTAPALRAVNTTVKRVGHCGLVFDQGVLDVVVDGLRRAELDRGLRRAG
jgi:triacylglycerol lipase